MKFFKADKVIMQSVFSALFLCVLCGKMMGNVLSKLLRFCLQ
jgi:hypothetical protein